MIIVALLYIFQDKLIFFPQKLSVYEYTFNNDSNIEKIKIGFDDLKFLRGWFRKKPIAGQFKVIIYFGGNAEEASYMITQSSKIKDCSILSVNYPGYGNSDGRPGEKEFYKASLRIYDFIISRNDIDKDNIIVFGRSIGTAVAIYLASQRKVKGIILVSPFESMVEVAKDNLSFVPVNLILKHKFDVRIYARKINTPMLCICGTSDNIIPPKHSKELLKNWKGQTEYHEINGFGHNDLFGSGKMWYYINGFLTKVK